MRGWRKHAPDLFLLLQLNGRLGHTNSCWPRTIFKRQRAAGRCVMIGVTFLTSPYLTYRSGCEIRTCTIYVFARNHHLLTCPVTIITQAVVVTSSNINHVSHSRHVHDHHLGYHLLVQHHPIITHPPTCHHH